VSFDLRLVRSLFILATERNHHKVRRVLHFPESDRRLMRTSIQWSWLRANKIISYQALIVFFSMAHGLLISEGKTFLSMAIIDFYNRRRL
jgi:hypothetical protein